MSRKTKQGGENLLNMPMSHLMNKIKKESQEGGKKKGKKEAEKVKEGGVNIAPFVSALALLGTRIINDSRFIGNKKFNLLGKNKAKPNRRKRGGDGEQPQLFQENDQVPTSMTAQPAMTAPPAMSQAPEMSSMSSDNLVNNMMNNPMQMMKQMTDNMNISGISGGRKSRAPKRGKSPAPKRGKSPAPKRGKSPAPKRRGRPPAPKRAKSPAKKAKK
jgi:hypothetical protein